MASVTYDNRTFGTNAYPATTTFSNYVYKSNFTPETVSKDIPNVANITTPANVATTAVPVNNVSNTAINFTSTISVDTTINVPGLEEELAVSPSEIFKDLTINPKLVESTDNTGWQVVGEGIFDNLMETAYKHLDAQFLSNRIKQEDYATSHLQIYISTLQMLSGQWLQLELDRKRLQAQVAIESKKLELQKAIQQKQFEIQIALQNKENELKVAQVNQANQSQILQQNEQNKIQVATTNQQTALQVAQVNQKKDADIASQETQLGVQIALGHDQTKASILTQRDGNESAERQNQARVDAQAALIAAQVEVEKAKKVLHYRQVEGFDEDYKQKLLKIQLDTWAVAFSVASDNAQIGGSNIPDAALKGGIDALYETFIIPDLDAGASSATNTRNTSTING